MLPTEHLLAFALTTFVLVVSPGPSVPFTWAER
jgi:threonine/homoserine/homoserine lactone efflux protein